ncbi:MAG TPA: hypothetical protein PLP17_13035, partial [Oligoflexia bacterium]|nr:hypothetical protein [Oligoflexia bacterium]
MAHRGCPLVLRNRAPQPCETLSLPPPAVEQFSEIQRFSLEHARDNPRLKKELQELNALLSAANDIERRHETVRTADAQAKLRGPAAHWAIWQNTMEQLAEKLSSPQLDLDAAALEVRAQREQVQK